MSIRLIKQIYFKLPLLIKLLISIFLFMFIFGYLIHIAEPDQFPSIFDGIWWAFITGATVGYGDFVPSTPIGKLVTILLILTGCSLIAFYITSLAASTFRQEQAIEEGRVAFKGSHHLVLIGWNERSRRLIESIAQSNSHIQMVLIDTTLGHVSFSDYPVHFIQGDPTEDLVLKKANIKLAERVLITTDTAKNERDADNITILTAVAIRGNHPTIPIIAEIVTSTQIENAHRAGATTIIRSNDFTSVLFYQELFRQATSKPFEDVFHLLGTQQFYHEEVQKDLEGVSFQDTVVRLRKKQQILLGIIRDDRYHINPSPTFRLKKGDQLIGLIPRGK
ncbi:potassium channel family protein [Virgibacillus pantothenticus]|uniref:potassium channel family protein n=1 Tax=Virgibacillus pantothenticus TaxID=1473 RepID=UPI000987D576|nr:potassium channel family protein [Virgibacillus pantothenticus]